MKKTVDLQIVYRDPKELVPYVNNARTHSDEQVRQIAASIKEFGFNDPVELDGDKGIISGHGRVQAALLLGLDRIPTVDLHGLSEAQKKAYILAANKIALNSGWDEDLLKVEFEELKAVGSDLALTGFFPDEIESIVDGWESDLPELEDSQTDSDLEKIVIHVSKDDKDHAKEIIENALESAGIEYE